MAYDYFKNSSELKPYKEKFNDAMKSEAISSLHEKYSFFYRLVGSAKRNLVLRDDEKNEGFDLDYQIVFYQNQKGKSSDNYIAIKNDFRTAFDDFFTKQGFKHGDDSTTAITIKKLNDDETINYSYDVVLLSPNDDGSYSSFHYENHEKTIMQLAMVKDSKDFQKKYKKVKKEMWNDVREKYKYKKNNNIQNKKSFSLLVDTINEIIK